MVVSKPKIFKFVGATCFKNIIFSSLAITSMCTFATDFQPPRWPICKTRFEFPRQFRQIFMHAASGASPFLPTLKGFPFSTLAADGDLNLPHHIYCWCIIKTAKVKGIIKFSGVGGAVGSRRGWSVCCERDGITYGGVIRLLRPRPSDLHITSTQPSYHCLLYRYTLFSLVGPMLFQDTSNTYDFECFSCLFQLLISQMASLSHIKKDGISS